MKIKHFQDTDTLYIEFKGVEVVETREVRTPRRSK